MKVMSFNIRFPTDTDGPNAWRFRRDLAIDLIHHHRPDSFGVQEAVHSQMVYLREHLPDYAAIGVGRDDGAERGEYSAIFYRKQALHCLRSDTFWLSETPDVAGTVGWDAHNIRICTWGEFRDAEDRRVFLFNTHLDHRGALAQIEGARLILDRMDALSDTQPAILTGDFNCIPDSAPYLLITGEDPSAVEEQSLADARQLSTAPPTGPAWTFHGYRPPGTYLIDYIFVRNVAGVRAFHTLDDHRGARYPSDHLPVLADISL